MTSERFSRLQKNLDSPEYCRYIARNLYSGYLNRGVLFTNKVDLGCIPPWFNYSDFMVFNTTGSQVNTSFITSVIRPIGAQILIFDKDLKLPKQLYSHFENLGFIVTEF